MFWTASTDSLASVSPWLPCEVHLDVGGLAVVALRARRGQRIAPEVLNVLDVLGVGCVPRIGRQNPGPPARPVRQPTAALGGPLRASSGRRPPGARSSPLPAVKCSEGHRPRDSERTGRGWQPAGAASNGALSRALGRAALERSARRASDPMGGFHGGGAGGGGFHGGGARVGGGAGTSALSRRKVTWWVPLPLRHLRRRSSMGGIALSMDAWPRAAWPCSGPARPARHGARKGGAAAGGGAAGSSAAGCGELARTDAEEPQRGSGRSSSRSAA